jgi:hypothetical protein
MDLSAPSGWIRAREASSARAVEARRRAQEISWARATGGLIGDGEPAGAAQRVADARRQARDVHLATAILLEQHARHLEGKGEPEKARQARVRAAVHRQSA